MNDQVREYAGRREGGGEAGFFGAHGRASYNVSNSPFVIFSNIRQERATKGYHRMLQ